MINVSFGREDECFEEDLLHTQQIGLTVWVLNSVILKGCYCIRAFDIFSMQCEVSVILPGIAGRTYLLTKYILGLNVVNFQLTFALPSGFVNGLCCWSRPIKYLDHICCREMSYSSWRKHGH